VQISHRSKHDRGRPLLFRAVSRTTHIESQTEAPRMWGRRGRSQSQSADALPAGAVGGGGAIACASEPTGHESPSPGAEWRK